MPMMSRVRRCAVVLLVSVPGASQPPGGTPPGPRELSIKARFDADKDGRLDASERAQARAWVKENGTRRGRGRGGPGRGPDREPEVDAPPREPVRVEVADAATYPTRRLYDRDVIRTIFLVFPQADWFEECADFCRTDVEVPATMTVDGVEYPGVGVGFRGNSSYFAVRGKKKSFAIAVDATDDKLRLYGYRTLNLLNAHSDPSFLREVLHAMVARQFTPALQANLVQLVVNGESWGVYANVQQFNKDFLDEEFGTRKGVRWKVPASFTGTGLAYVGEDLTAYDRAYQLKDEPKDADAAWQRLIRLCRVLTETPIERLPAELPKVLDVDAALRFLALDAVSLDGDGYGSRGSDFVLWEGVDERFVPLPYDSNEIFGAQGAPRGGGRAGARGGPPGERRGGRGGRGGPGAAPAPTSSPLALADSGKPLARLLQWPEWKARYLAFVHGMAREGLDWSVLGPNLERLHRQIDPLVRADDKALYSHAAFADSLGRLEATIATRRKALLEHESMQLPWPVIDELVGTLVASGDRTAVQVQVSVEGAGRVLLWSTERRTDAFVAVPMYDDGAHDDGDANDGVYGATTPTFANHGRAHVYVEAVAPGDAAVTFSPTGGGGRARVVDLRRR